MSSKDIMVQNIDSILQRGERLDLLIDKTDTLAGQAYAFRKGARSVRRQQWWRNVRIMVLTGLVGVVGQSALFSTELTLSLFFTFSSPSSVEQVYIVRARTDVSLISYFVYLNVVSLLFDGQKTYGSYSYAGIYSTMRISQSFTSRL